MDELFAILATSDSARKIGRLGVLRIDDRVQQSDRRFAVDSSLLVRKRDISGPHRRGEAGSAVAILGGEREGEVGLGAVGSPDQPGRRGEGNDDTKFRDGLRVVYADVR